MALTYIDWEREDVLVLKLTGRITLGAGTSLLRRLIDDALKLDRKHILLNLGEVIQIDSSGLGELVSCRSKVSNEGGSLKLCKLTSRAAELLQYTKLYTVFEVFPDEDAGVGSFKSGLAE